MYLRITQPEGAVKISAPLTLPLHVIRTHLTQKLTWINATRLRLKAQPRLPTPTLQTGETHYFLGKPYPLVLQKHAGPVHIEFRDESMHFFVNIHATEADIARNLQRWYLAQMQALIPGLLQKWEPIIGVNVRAWRIRHMKTRWGSCHVTEQRICLNLALIKKPIACLEYVLVHELVHLHEANHSKRFYALMTQYMPQWPLYKKQLAECEIHTRQTT